MAQHFIVQPVGDLSKENVVGYTWALIRLLTA